MGPGAAPLPTTTSNAVLSDAPAWSGPGVNLANQCLAKFITQCSMCQTVLNTCVQPKRRVAQKKAARGRLWIGADRSLQALDGKAYVALADDLHVVATPNVDRVITLVVAKKTIAVLEKLDALDENAPVQNYGIDAF